MLTTRDRALLIFLETFHVADTKQIERLFFAGLRQAPRVTRRRLAHLVTIEKGLHRVKDPFSGRYLYVLGRWAQLRHRQLVTEVYVRLKTGPGRLYEFRVEYSIGSLRADAFAVYELHDQVFLFLVEVQTSHNRGLDVAKYERLYESGNWSWPVFPRIVFIADRQGSLPSTLNVRRIPTDFTGWDSLFSLSQ